MSQVINWGIIGPGKIARKFADDLIRVPQARLMAVGSRSKERADAFAHDYGIAHVYDSYEAFAQCKDIDIVYVATPHTYHKEHTLLCLTHELHVLCEKPMGINSIEVREMIQKAKDHKCLLMEAMWTAFLPAYQKMKSLIKNGVIGSIKMIEADFGFNGPVDYENRLYNPHLAGGSLLDVGIYPVFLAIDLLGMPDQVMSMSEMTVTGVDAFTSIQMQWEKGAMAQLHSSINTDTKTTCKIYGTDRYIQLNQRWHESHYLGLYDRNGLVEEWNFEYDYRGYKYEIEEVHRCIMEGKIQSSILSHDLSVLLHETVDLIRTQIGLKYPME